MFCWQYIYIDTNQQAFQQNILQYYSYEIGVNKKAFFYKTIDIIKFHCYI